MRVVMSMLLPAFLLAQTRGTANHGVKRLEWIDPQGRRPTGYAEWVRAHAVETDRARIGWVSATGWDGVVDVVVNADLYPDIVTELVQYSADLTAAGYAVRVDTMRGMSHAALRSHLAGINGLVGAVLVGELPTAWYEDDWGGSAPEEFPIDLYFMDLNGTWTDSDADGLFDDHTGSTAPEIWVGRLAARPLTWDDEVRLMRRYFAKNHLYRTGQLVLPDRGLSFVDDDWQGSGSAYLSQVYSSCVVIENAESTNANNFRRQLVQGYEWIHVMAHSSPWGNTFRTPSRGYTGTVFNCEVWAIRPRAHFYNLFACSGARYTEENYSAGWEVFHDDCGLAAVGSTKTGSMLGFQYFYGPLGRDSCIGDAFKSWFAEYGLMDPDWFYGMTIVGDPTLKPHNNTTDGHSPFASRRPPEETDRPAEVVCTHPETDDSPQLLAVSDTVWAIWKSSRNPANGRFDIFAACRHDGVWSGAYNVGSAYYWETDPCLGLDRNGRPIAVWSVFTDEYHYNLYWSAWNGSSWSTAQEIAEDPSSDMQASLTRDSSGTLWCLYLSRQDLWADVWAASFNGTSWTAPVNVTRDTVTELYPKAATMPDGTVWVAYSRYVEGQSRIYASYRSGGNWVHSGPVSGGQRRAFRPSIAVGDSGRPVVCWHGFDSGAGDIWSSFWTGASWTSPIPVSGDSEADVVVSAATASQGLPVAVWMRREGDDWDIHSSWYSGGNWSAPAPVEPQPGPDINPAVASTSGGGVVFAWQHLSAGNWDINAGPGQNPGCSEAQPTPAPVLSVVPSVGKGRVAVRWQPSGKGQVKLAVYDVGGREVRTLQARPRDSGGCEVVWDGSDNVGRPVAAGTYLFRLRTESGQSVALTAIVR